MPCSDTEIKTKSFHSTVAITFEAKEKVRWIRDLGIPINTKQLVSKFLIDFVDDFRANISDQDLAALERISDQMCGDK